MFLSLATWSLQFNQWGLLCSARTALVFSLALILTRLWMLKGPMPRLPFPPGPSGVPFLGYLPYISNKHHLTFTELGRTFGSVYQVFLGSKRVVVVSDPNLVREAFKQPVFSGRPDTELTKLLQGYGIINSDGALWKEQRSFLHNVLREFGAKNSGTSNTALENNIQVQVKEFLSGLADLNGEPCKVRAPLSKAVSNVVGSILMSVTFKANEFGYERLIHLIEEGFRLLTIGVAVNFIPLLRYFPSYNSGYLKIKSNKLETASYFHNIAEEHKKTLDTNNVRDFVDAFLIQQQKIRHSNKDSYFSEQQLLQVMGDIFSAGLETVTSTLEWCVLFLVRYPQVQRRVQEELDEVVGEGRMPCLEDRPHLPYTEATILEVLRRANVVALGNSHATLEDTELGGFFIPKNSHVLPNLWAIHMDPELWESPEEFRPDRFLVDGKVTKPSYFMPFSVGRRMCVGDNLARMQVFQFLSSLFHQFNLSTPEGDDPPSLEGVSGVSMTAQPFRVCAIPRRKPYLF